MSIIDDAVGLGKKVVGGIGSAAGDVADAVVGSGTDPGLLGLSKQKQSVHEIDKGNFTNPASQQEQDDLAARRAAVDSRQAPTMSTTQIGDYHNAAVQQSSPYTGTAPVERAQVAGLGAASQTPNALINRGADSQARGYSIDLLNQLRDQAAGNGVGQKLAQSAYDQANELGLKNAMALAASRRGTGAPSLTGVLDASAAGRATNAAQLSQDKMKAMIAAQQQLGDVASGVRGQDIGVETSQAGFDDTAAARNAAANNEFGLAKFGAANTASAINSGAFNANEQFNAKNVLDNNQFNAGLAEKTGEFNAGQQNSRTGAQAQMDQATKQANLEAYLKAQGMSDEMAQYYTSQMLGLNEADRQANEDYEQLKTTQEQGANAADQKSFEAARAARQKAIGGAAEVGTDLIGKSDRKSKKEVKPLDYSRLMFSEDGWY